MAIIIFLSRHVIILLLFIRGRIGRQTIDLRDLFRIISLQYYNIIKRRRV